MASIHTLDNGLVVIVEEISHVQSVAYNLFIPGGIVFDQPDRIGCSLILAELTCRGAGGLSSRELSDAFDGLGIRHGESAGQDRFSYSGALLEENLPRAFELTAKMLSAPDLPDDEIPNIKSILLQDIYSLNDNPIRRAMIELSGQYFPKPFNRPSIGTEDGIVSASASELKEMWSNCYRPKGAVLSVAGKVNTSEVQKNAEKFFGNWEGVGCEKPEFGEVRREGAVHIPYDGAQLQITLSYPSAKFGDEHYYTAKVATSVLSGGMSGRLTEEVREKRGLCYTVMASHSANANYGATMCYAGTTPERAQETLDVTVDVLNSLKGTVTDDELIRAKAQIRSSLIISEESTASRAASNAGDWWTIKSTRSLDEIAAEIAKVTTDDIDAYLEAYPPNPFFTLTLGSKELDIPGGAQ